MYFAKGEMEYLGHVISSKGVNTNLKKIAAMVEWPRPHNNRGVKGIFEVDRVL